MSDVSTDITWHLGAVNRDARPTRGATVWLTGLSGSGKSTIAVELERMLVDSERAAYRLGSDNLRHGLNANLGFTETDRAENVCPVGEVARLFADAGVIALVQIVSPFAAARAEIRRMQEEAGLAFIEVFVATPLGECERRDPKGLYARARSGALSGFTGVDAPYEAPRHPNFVVHTAGAPPVELAREILGSFDVGWCRVGRGTSRGLCPHVSGLISGDRPFARCHCVRLPALGRASSMVSLR